MALPFAARLVEPVEVAGYIALWSKHETRPGLKAKRAKRMAPALFWNTDQITPGLTPRRFP